MTFEEQAALIRGSKLMHPKWYARTYPDVAALGMDPVEHYLRYGAAMGRRPSAGFDAAFYRATHPDVDASGIDPLAHYLRKGAKTDRRIGPADLAEARRAARRVIDPIRRKLFSLGFVARAQAELAALAGAGETPLLRAHAARELAVWELRAGTAEGARACLAWLPAAADCAEEGGYFASLATLELLCLHGLGAPEAAAEAVLARAEAADWPLEDLLLARGNLAADPPARLGWINRALARRGFAPVALAEGGGAAASAYDRLSAPTAGPAIADGPLITVLIAAYDAERTLPAALRGLQEQLWRNLEILVIDDCSSDATAAVAARFAAADPRIRLIEMASNGGAYVARNRGLAEANGAFVTLHDADDWSHPAKIATQAAFLLAHPEAVGCTSEQARATDGLTFERLTRSFRLVNMNTSSFMFRRAYVRATCGFWDTARFGADTELIARITSADGRGAVRKLATGPLSFQRMSATSIVADEAFGFSIMYHGARLIYSDLYARHHRRADALRYDGARAPRPFPAPATMRADRPAAGPRAYDMAFAGDLAAADGALAADVARAADAGLTVAVFPVFDYDRPRQDFLIAAPVCDLLAAGRAEVIAYGEAIACRLLVLRDLGCFQDEQRYLPAVRTEAARFVLAAAELGPDPAAAARALGRAADFVRRSFGRDAAWRPADAAARAALAALPPAGEFAAAPPGDDDEDWDAARAFAELPRAP